jgi:foldase protein PrsA
VAAAAGVTITDEQLDDIIQADIEAVGGREAFEARLVSNNLTAEEYREQVRANVVAQRVQMQMPVDIPDTLEHVHARHILVATQAEAEAILAQLREGADFGTLAQTYSLDVSTRDRGGDLGFFPRGLLLAPELEEAAFALAPAQISDVVHSDLLGYHIVQVLEREERPTDEQNLELIRTNQINLWREQLWAGASIERFIEP